MTALNLTLLQLNGPRHMMDGWGGGYGMAFMILFWLLILALVISIIWFLFRKGRESTSSVVAGKSPLEILDIRYAKGEISKKEYEEMKKELTK